MALVRTIKPITKERQALHEETDCCVSVFTDSSGKKYLQLDTYGSSKRKLAGKVSQAIQFDQGASAHLKRLIEETFPTLR